jgi:hypothetical protein
MAVTIITDVVFDTLEAAVLGNYQHTLLLSSAIAIFINFIITNIIAVEF